MAKEQGTFSIDDVLDRLSVKLVGRHPHVFGDGKAETAVDVKRNWEALKAEEKKKSLEKKTKEIEGEREPDRNASVLAGISTKMPALIEAQKLSSRAAQMGFDWPDVELLLEKISEEVSELREELRAYPAPGPRPEGRGVAGSGRPSVPEELRLRMEEEVGDLFFTLVNVARYLALDPESALRRSNRKFRRRFHAMEKSLHEKGATLEGSSLDELEALWQQAKQEEKSA